MYMVPCPVFLTYEHQNVVCLNKTFPKSVLPIGNDSFLCITYYLQVPWVALHSHTHSMI